MGRGRAGPGLAGEVDRRCTTSSPAAVTEAVEQARAAAGDGTVSVAGGAGLARQLLAEGLLDQLMLHVVPVLFGSGTRLLDGLTDQHVGLELLEVIDTPAAVHLRYGVNNETG